MSKIAAAAFLGLLTGQLIGLAASGVVASVISALLAMAAGVAALTGVENPFLKDKVAAQERRAAHDAAIAAFALCAVLGVGGGLWARTHNLLSPGPAEVAAEWEAAGLPPEVAARVAVLSLTGATLTAKGEVTPGGTGATRGSLLFSAEGAGDCVSADPKPAPSAAEARNSWTRLSAPWPALAEALPEAEPETLRGVWSALCEN